MLKAATLADSCKSIDYSNFLLPHWTNMTQFLKFLQKKHYDSRQFDILSLLKKNSIQYYRKRYFFSSINMIGFLKIGVYSVLLLHVYW